MVGKGRGDAGVSGHNGRERGRRKSLRSHKLCSGRRRSRGAGNCSSVTQRDKGQRHTKAGGGDGGGAADVNRLAMENVQLYKESFKENYPSH